MLPLRVPLGAFSDSAFWLALAWWGGRHWLMSVVPSDIRVWDAGVTNVFCLFVLQVLADL